MESRNGDEDYNFLKIPEEYRTHCELPSDVRGHSYYTGYGRGKNGDYWNCYCIEGRGSKPPTLFKDLLKWVDNPEDVLKWKER
jgi:hypothetical protein